MPRIIQIPADFRPLLTKCLLGIMHDAAEALERCGLDPKCYPEPLEQFDAIRAALDTLGWGAAAEIDVDVHGDALQRALSHRLASERHLYAEGVAVAEKGNPAGETQRDTAYGYACQLEAFMHTAGLPIAAAGERNG
jgi:hypothetical protein